MSDEPDDSPFFSKELIERWISLPADKPLVVPLGRLEIDGLVLSIRQSIIAQSHAGVALRQLIDGHKDESQKTWEMYVQSLQSAFDHINAFMGHVMASARVEGENEREGN